MSYLDHLKAQQPKRKRPRPPVNDCIHTYQRIDDAESRCIYCGHLRDDR